MFAIVIISTCTALPIETKWRQWKEQHGKIYLNGKEEFQKKVTWARNARFIEDFNQREHSYSLAMNHFSDMVRAHAIYNGSSLPFLHPVSQRF